MQVEIHFLLLLPFLSGFCHLLPL
uniref:Uncharacterized protein n=1 Tax=Anguilla anguilla TaxID=7936 RepID=A0A0E9XRY3_ANGAN